MNLRHNCQCSKGFSLIEIIVVLVVISIIALLLPHGLQRLYSRSNLDNTVQSVARSLHDCALQAQVSQRTLAVDTDVCPITLPSDFKLTFEASGKPVFYADGTSNGKAVIVSDTTQQIGLHVDRLTSNINISKNVIN